MYPPTTVRSGSTSASSLHTIRKHPCLSHFSPLCLFVAFLTQAKSGSRTSFPPHPFIPTHKNVGDKEEKITKKQKMKQTLERPVSADSYAPYRSRTDGLDITSVALYH